MPNDCATTSRVVSAPVNDAGPSPRHVEVGFYKGMLVTASGVGGTFAYDPVNSFAPVTTPDLGLNTSNFERYEGISVASDFYVLGETGGFRTITKISGDSGGLTNTGVTLAQHTTFAADYGSTVSSLYPYNVYTNGTYIFVATSARGLAIFNADLSPRGFVHADISNGPSFGPMVAHGNRLWAAHGGGDAVVAVLDITNVDGALTPTTITMPDRTLSVAAVPAADRIYVGHFNGTISIMDATATSPTPTAFTLGGTGQVRSLAVAGNRLFVGRADFGTNPRTTRVEIYDITNPDTPVLGDTLSLGDAIPDSLAINASQGELYAADGNNVHVLSIGTCL